MSTAIRRRLAVLATTVLAVTATGTALSTPAQADTFRCMASFAQVSPAYLTHHDEVNVFWACYVGARGDVTGCAQGLRSIGGSLEERERACRDAMEP
jgi:hypothetical protein